MGVHVEKMLIVRQTKPTIFEVRRSAHSCYKLGLLTMILPGQWTRAFCSASLVGAGGIGGIAGSLIFRPEDAPEYLNGLWACMTCCLIIGIICITLDWTFWRKNKKADAGEMVIEGGDVSGQAPKFNTRSHADTDRHRTDTRCSGSWDLFRICP